MRVDQKPRTRIRPSKKPVSPASKKTKRAKIGDDDGELQLLYWGYNSHDLSFCVFFVRSLLLWKAMTRLNESMNGDINCRRRF